MLIGLHTLFFEEIANSLNKMTYKYDVLLTRDFNIDPLDKSKDTNNHLSDLCHTFSPKNLVIEITCFNSHEETLLANRAKRFRSTSVVETGLGDCYKLIPFFNAYFKKLTP